MINNNIININGVLLGLDLGSKFDGIAISNFEQTIALPLDIISPIDLSKNLENLIKIKKVVGLIIGWPLTLKGEEAQQCAFVRKRLIDDIEKFDIPFFLYDERFSSKMKMPIGKRKDSYSAAWILQGFLNSHR